MNYNASMQLKLFYKLKSVNKASFRSLCRSFPSHKIYLLYIHLYTNFMYVFQEKMLENVPFACLLGQNLRSGDVDVLFHIQLIIYLFAFFFNNDISLSTNAIYFLMCQLFLVQRIYSSEQSLYFH